MPRALLSGCSWAACTSHVHIYKPPSRIGVETVVFWLPFHSCTELCISLVCRRVGCEGIFPGAIKILAEGGGLRHHCWWPLHHWSQDACPILPEEKSDSSQLSKKAESFLREPSGSSVSPQSLLTATQIWGAKRRLCLKAAALQVA